MQFSNRSVTFKRPRGDRLAFSYQNIFYALINTSQRLSNEWYVLKHYFICLFVLLSTAHIALYTSSSNTHIALYTSLLTAYIALYISLWTTYIAYILLYWPLIYLIYFFMNHLYSLYTSLWTTHIPYILLYWPFILQ